MTKIQNNDYVCYIIKTRKEKFRTFLGKAIFMEDDNDSVIHVVAKGSNYETEKDAQNHIKNDAPKDAHQFLNAIPSSFTGITWLSELER